VLDLDNVDWAKFDSIRQAALAAHPASRFESHVGRMCSDVLRQIGPVLAELIDEAPWNSLERARASVDPARLDEWLARLNAAGDAHHLILLRLTDGSIAGITDATWRAGMPEWAWHGFTGVRSVKRGGGIAKALKAVILSEMKRAHPSIQKAFSSYAVNNRAMHAVNTSLGFKAKQPHWTYQIRKEEFSWFISRPTSIEQNLSERDQPP
jgi:RimJ/RimL family protein N-acetyltransferase